MADTMKTMQRGRVAYVLHPREPHQERIGDEPDRVDWAEVPDPHDRSGIVAYILRDDRTGAWRGYIRVTPEHPWYGVSTSALPDEAHDATHGGVTLSTPYGLIGWDASHYGDRSPWQPPGDPSYSSYDGTYVTARAAEMHTRRLARAALAAMYPDLATASPAEVIHDDA